LSGRRCRLVSSGVAHVACADFPPAHWKKIWSTNPLERVNKEIKHRTDVVGVVPNPAALLRQAGAVLIETHERGGGALRSRLRHYNLGTGVLHAAQAVARVQAVGEGATLSSTAWRDPHASARAGGTALVGDQPWPASFQCPALWRAGRELAGIRGVQLHPVAAPREKKG
jgi:hypothetical protein